jgi:glycosyltransferase involved in cell wall biosynthesis
MDVDVVIITKNSQRMLGDCIKSIYKNVPVNHLIIIDGHSTDKTLEIVRQFQKQHQNILVFQDHGNRATARQKGISKVETEWFVFVDSDAVLCKDWFKKAEKLLNQKVGGLWGVEIWSTIQNSTVLKLFLLITRKIFDLRGGTHDTLVRTDLVKDIKIPKKLHVFEDAFVRDWIIKKGYKIIACYDPFCLHFRPESVWTLRGSLGIIADAIRMGRVSLLLRLTLPYGFYTAYSIFQLARKRIRQSLS